ncbi:MAG: hypothetical protein ACPGWR_13540, partial [Ardenticatenaceae bacterium]
MTKKKEEKKKTPLLFFLYGRFFYISLLRIIVQEVIIIRSPRFFWSFVEQRIDGILQRGLSLPFFCCASSTKSTAAG